MVNKYEEIWERLKKSQKPVVLYGMGNGAKKIIDQCNFYEIKIADIFASDEYARGQQFEGFDVLKYSDITNKYDDCIILICFAVFEQKLLEKIYDIAKKYTVLAPDVPLVSGKVFTNHIYKMYQEEIELARSLLADELSKKVFDGTIEYKLTGDINVLKNIQTDRSEVFNNIYKFNGEQKDEIFYDLGGYDGDTVCEFISYCPNYKNIVVLEPDVKNYKKLINTIEQNSFENVQMLNAGGWSESGTLVFDGRGSRSSALLKYAPPKENKRRGAKEYEIEVFAIDDLKHIPTIIKMDVEGAEQEVLEGGKNTLANYKPRLQVSAYHKSEDFFKLVLQINSINPQYKIYLRHHPYIPAWETNIYCI